MIVIAMKIFQAGSGKKFLIRGCSKKFNQDSIDPD